MRLQTGISPAETAPAFRIDGVIMDCANHAAQAMKKWGSDAIGALLHDVDYALRQGNEAQALFLDAVLQEVEELSGSTGAYGKEPGSGSCHIPFC